MKRTCVFCVLVASCVCVFVHGQVGVGFTDGVKVDIIDGKFVQQGNPVALDALKINLQLNYPQCTPLVSQSNARRTGGWVAQGAGWLFLVGGVSTLITGWALENPYAAQYLYTASTINFLVAGTCFLVSIPLHRSSFAYLSQAVGLYNQTLSSSTPGEAGGSQ